MAEVGAYYITILPSMNSFTKKCKEELGAAGVGGGESFADRFKATLMGSAVGTALAGLASKAAGFLSEGLDAGIKRYDTLSNYPKVMENLGYSTDEAAKSIKTIQEHLDGLPTSTDEMVRLTTSIADSTGDLDLATKAALGFNDMLLASGATTADVTSATEIFNRILGKHSATTAQWASIQQHIPAHLTAIAEHMLGAGHSSEELRDALNDGTVSWDDFLRAIAELDESGYVNQFGEQCASVEQQARDMTGGIDTAIRNVTNAVGRGWVAIMEVFGRDNISSAITNLGKTAEAGMKEFAGWLQYAKDKIGETAIGENFGKIMEAVSNAANDLQAKAGPVIQDITDKMVAWIDKALQWLVDHGDQIGEFVGKIGDALGEIASAAGSAFEGFVSVMGDWISKALEWLINHGDLVAGTIKAIAAYLAFKGVASAVTGVTGALGAVIHNFDTLGRVLPLLDGAKDLPQLFSYISQQGGPLAGVFKALGEKTGSFATGFGALKDKIANATWLGTLHDKLDGLGTKFMGLVPKAGEALKGVGGKFAELAKSLPSKMGGAFELIHGKLDGLGTKFMGLVPKIGQGVSGIVGKLGSFGGKIVELGGLIGGKLAGAWTAFTGLIAANPIVLGIAAVAAAIAGLTWFFTQTELGRELWGKFTKFIGDAWQGVQDFFAGIPEFWGGIWEGAKAKCEEFVGNVKAGWEGLKEGAGTAFEAVKGAITDKLETAKTIGTNTIGMFGAALKGDWDGVATHAQEVWGAIDSTVTGKLQGMKDAGIPLVSDLAAGALDAWEGLKNDLVPTLTEIGTNITNKWEEIKTGADNAFGAVKKAITDKLETAKTIGTNTVGAFGAAIKGDWNGVASHAQEVWGAVDSTVTGKLQGMKDAGIPLVSDLAAGALDAWEGLKKDLVPTLTEIGTNITNKWEEIKTGVGDFIDDIKSGATQKWEEIQSGIGNTVEDIKSNITDAFDSAKETALGIFESIRDGIVGKIEDAKNTLSNIIETIKGLFNFEWSLPAPKLPHITWHTQNIAGIVDIPVFDGVEWYAKGGIFDNPTIIGVGEAGREAVLPLNPSTYREIARDIRDEMGDEDGVSVLVTGNTFVVREEADIDRVADALARKGRRERWAKR